MRPQTLPTIEPSEADLYDMAVSAPLNEKIEKAVGLLQQYESMALSMSDQGYWLAYSGGKDSNAILELAKMAGVKFRPVYNVTTLDPPELVWYIKREHPEVEFHHPKEALLTMLPKHSRGPPTRMVRWCCEHYKEHGGDGMAKVIGVRAPESAKRKNVWSTVTNNRRLGKIFCPVVYWTEQDVWEFHRQRGLSYCSLYDEGFTRLGCIGCPMGNTKNQKAEFARWPAFEKAWKRAFQRYWNTWHGVPTRAGKRRYFEDFGSWQGLWDWWLNDTEKQQEEPECQGFNLFS